MKLGRVFVATDYRMVGQVVKAGRISFCGRGVFYNTLLNLLLNDAVIVSQECRIGA